MLYLGTVHKDPDSCYGITFPDVPGCFSAGDTLEELISMSREALDLHLEDERPPRARSYEELLDDPEFHEALDGAVILLPIEFRQRAFAAWPVLTLCACVDRTRLCSVRLQSEPGNTYP